MLNFRPPSPPIEVNFPPHFSCPPPRSSVGTISPKVQSFAGRQQTGKTRTVNKKLNVPFLGVNFQVKLVSNLFFVNIFYDTALSTPTLTFLRPSTFYSTKKPGKWQWWQHWQCNFTFLWSFSFFSGYYTHQPRSFPLIKKQITRFSCVNRTRQLNLAELSNLLLLTIITLSNPPINIIIIPINCYLSLSKCLAWLFSFLVKKVFFKSTK